MPIMPLMESASPAISNAPSEPIGMKISELKIMNGVRSPPNVMLMTRKTSPTAIAIAMPMLAKPSVIICCPPPVDTSTPLGSDKLSMSASTCFVTEETESASLTVPLTCAYILPSS
ncbi:hypothetical protein D3C78_1710910 [compost metagenome]